MEELFLLSVKKLHQNQDLVLAKVQKICFENGFVAEKGGRGGSVMRCLCALNITKDEVNTAMDIFEKVVLQVAKDYE